MFREFPFTAHLKGKTMVYKKERLKILIVDDNTIDLDILESILTQIGFQDIIKSQSGEEALRLVEQHRPDLVITDIMMPKLDGGAFRALLMENPVTKHIPVIFITAIITPQEEKAHGGLLNSGDILIAKPYSKDKIAVTINAALLNAPVKAEG